MSQLSGTKNPLGPTTTLSASKTFMSKQVDLKEFKCNDNYEGYSWYDHGQSNAYLGKVENYQHNLENLSTGPLGRCKNHVQSGEFLSTPVTNDYVTPYKANVVRPVKALQAPNLELIK